MSDTTSNERRTSDAVAHRELRRRFVARRALLFATRQQAARALGWSHRTQDVLETGEQPIRLKHLAQIFDAFEIPDDERDEWQRLAAGAQTKGWWETIPDAVASPSARQYMALEWGAGRIRSYAGLFVPALLQTPAYTAAVLNSWSPQPAERVNRVVDARRRRRAVLEPPDPLDYHVIVDEALLHRNAGPGVMTEQVAHILDMAATHPNIKVQVLPFAAGLYAGQGSPFNLLDFGVPDDPGLVHVEPGLAEPMYMDDESEFFRYAQLFDHYANDRAASSDDTVELLQQRLHALGASDG